MISSVNDPIDSDSLAHIFNGSSGNNGHENLLILAQSLQYILSFWEHQSVFGVWLDRSESSIVVKKNYQIGIFRDVAEI
jgi:hypothetical protein